MKRYCTPKFSQKKSILNNGFICSVLILIFFISISIINVHSWFYDNYTYVQNPNIIIPNLKCSGGQQLNFSGYTWYIRSSNGEYQGPGPNLFNNSNENVWVDENGSLHLKIRKIGDNWTCSEVYLTRSLGYGTYIFIVKPGFQNLNENTVVGLFTYLDDEHEIDIEFSRWGDTAAANAQFTVQPYYHTGNTFRYNISYQDQSSIHYFTWCSNYIKFISEYGNEFNSSQNQKIIQWVYTGNDIPRPSNEVPHINFWLMNGLPPSDYKDSEVIIEKFMFVPDPCNESFPKSIDGYKSVLFISLAFYLGLLSRYFRKFKFKK
ncbi:MAG: glycoside hydrolase family 16 protein [Promethearchaeota archaeon]